jgi:hypothetical protein
MKELMNEWKKFILNEQFSGETQPETQSDRDAAKGMGTMTSRQGLVYRTIGFLITYMVSKPDKAAAVNPSISQLQQNLQNPQSNLDEFTQRSISIVQRETREDVKQYWYNISKEFQKGGIKAAQAYIQSFEGQQKQTTISSTPKSPGAEVESGKLGAKNNPATDIFYLKNMARANPNIYTGKVAYYYGPNRVLQTIQF